MYHLIHATNYIFIKHIIKDMCLKSNKITKNISQGSGQYENGASSFVYFGVSNKLFHPGAIGQVIIYFSSDAIKNKTIYVADYHAADPMQTKKYKKDIDKNKIYKHLYEKSIRSNNSKYFNIYQQIAVKNSVKLNGFLTGIDFVVKNINDLRKVVKIIAYIKKIIDVPVNIREFL